MVAAFPLPPAPFTGRARRVEIGAPFDWLREAWAFFADRPSHWLTCTWLSSLFLGALLIVPKIGPLAFFLALPLILTGLLDMCHRQGRGEVPMVADLLAGFTARSASPLLVIGAVLAVGGLIAFALSGLIAGGGLGSPRLRPGGLGAAFGSFMVRALLTAVLLTPVWMATAFAPALAHFHGMTPIAAMKASFEACARNWLALLIHALVFAVMLFFALLPAGLGLLILIPIQCGTLYASYRDIFPAS